jgi:cytochrome c oxidase subunit 2
VGKFWSLLFLLVPVLGVGVFVCAIANIGWQDHWFPKDVSANGYIIDGLFNFIMYLTGVIFIGTGLVLFIFLWKYDAERNAEAPKFTHGSHTLEVVWSILPVAALLFIAIYQMDTWAANKLRMPSLLGPDQIAGTADDIPKPPLAQVTGRQFEWRIQYAGADGIIGTSDDLYTVNDLHVPENEEIVLQMKSMDVLHSFFLPNLRLKQDVVPGMKQFVWFEAKQAGAYDIVCAELCGWGHYKMKGRLTVESRDDFDRWMAKMMAEQDTAELVASD